jgi:hypothetical protein
LCLKALDYAYLTLGRTSSPLWIPSKPWSGQRFSYTHKGSSVTQCRFRTNFFLPKEKEGEGISAVEKMTVKASVFLLFRALSQKTVQSAVVYHKDRHADSTGLGLEELDIDKGKNL